MKRYFALILAALLLMPTIVSCSQNGSDETKGADTTADTAATAAAAMDSSVMADRLMENARFFIALHLDGCFGF